MRKTLSGRVPDDDPGLKRGLHMASAVPAVFGDDQLELVDEMLATVKKTGLTYALSENNAYKNPFATEVALMRTSEGGMAAHTDIFLMTSLPLFCSSASLAWILHVP